MLLGKHPAKMEFLKGTAIYSSFALLSSLSGTYGVYYVMRMTEHMGFRVLSIGIAVFCGFIALILHDETTNFTWLTPKEEKITSIMYYLCIVAFLVLGVINGVFHYRYWYLTGFWLFTGFEWGALLTSMVKNPHIFRPPK